LSERKGNERFVRTDDCIKQHTRLELALFGQDGRAGMVKDLSDIKNYVSELKEEGKNKRKETLKWKLAALGFAFTLLGFLANNVLSKL